MWLSAEALNFSWVVPDELAGCRGIRDDEELSFLASLGIKALVRLAPQNEIEVKVEQVEAVGIEDYYEPIRDWTAPSPKQIRRVVAFVHSMISKGRPVAVSCGAGYGRTGTILCCYLVYQGLSTDKAIAEVTRRGRKPYETPQQLQAIEEYERCLRSS